MMNISTQGRVHFSVYLFTHKGLGHETSPINTYSHEQYFLGNNLHHFED